ncbi:MAG TPA: hypothetical protein VM778_04295, partial [Gemmatimonadota bacterium]|nr:hypothetical protein [Gemmatimonadota bacterium]
RYLDGEMDGRESGLLIERMRAEPATAARLEELQLRSWHLSAILPHADPSAQETARSGDVVRRTIATRTRAPRASWSPALRAAAIILVVLAGALAAPPARAWSADRLRAAAAAVGLATTPDLPPAPAQSAGETPAFAVAFAVTGDTFDVRVPGLGGTLVIRLEDRTDGSVQVTGAAITDHLVLIGGLHLEGTPSPDARYEIILPPLVRSVRLRIGDAAPTLHAIDTLTGQVTIPIGR